MERKPTGTTPLNNLTNRPFEDEPPSHESLNNICAKDTLGIHFLTRFLQPSVQITCVGGNRRLINLLLFASLPSFITDDGLNQGSTPLLQKIAMNYLTSMYELSNRILFLILSTILEAMLRVARNLPPAATTILLLRNLCRLCNILHLNLLLWYLLLWNLLMLSCSSTLYSLS